MTAQIAIFNERCVAVASDSVVTIGRGERQRTMSTAEKLFETAAGHPVVALHSGSATFMRVPYEVLIAEWRRSLTEPLTTLAGYAESFGTWLTRQSSLFGNDAQEMLFSWMLDDYFLMVRDRIIETLKERNLTSEPWDSIDVMAAVDSVTREHVDTLNARDEIAGREPETDAAWIADRAHLVQKSLDWVFDDVPHTTASDRMLRDDVPYLLISRAEPWGCDGTMAFVGYGANDMFPGYHSVTITGIINDHLIERPYDDLHISQTNRSGVTPFGQDEAVQTFIRAYNKQFLTAAHERLDAVLDEVDLDDPEGEQRTKFHEALSADFEDLSWESFVRPMLDTVESLPRADMARMAESLVGVQALRAASSDQQPTVGGPIDVVLITRADGVQWVRRKNPTAT